MKVIYLRKNRWQPSISLAERVILDAAITKHKSLPGLSPSQNVPLVPLQVCCKGFLTCCLFDALCSFWRPKAVTSPGCSCPYHSMFPLQFRDDRDLNIHNKVYSDTPPSPKAILASTDLAKYHSNFLLAWLSFQHVEWVFLSLVDLLCFSKICSFWFLELVSFQ